LSIRHLLVGSANVESPFKQVAPAKLIAGNLLFGCRLRRGFTRALGFRLLRPMLALRPGSGTEEFLCADGRIDSLLRGVRRLLCRSVSKLELLANNRARDSGV